MKNQSKIILITVCLFVIVISFYKFSKITIKSEDQVASSIIIESNSIEDVKKFAESETLFIFDYDNVLVEGKTDYGFDAWFCSAMNSLTNNGLDSKIALNKLLPIYENIQHTAEVKLVETCSKSLIDDLKKSGHKVIILTVRSLCLIESVFNQLKSVDIDISTGALAENGANQELAKIGAKYTDGILFCDGYYKGNALKVFLQFHPTLKAKNIVFIDDKLKNIDSVKSAAKDLEVNFVGIRYGKTDERTKAFVMDDRSKKLVQNILQDVSSIINHNENLRDTHAHC